MTIAESMQVWANLGEIEQRSRVVRRRFPVGSVVRRGDGERGTATRGIVVGHGSTGLAGLSDDLIVRVQASVEHHSNDLDAWEHVPIDEQTADERVRAASAHEPHADDDESPAWYLLAALLPPRTFDKLTGGYCDWPTETDLAIELARRIDKRGGL